MPRPSAPSLFRHIPLGKVLGKKVGSLASAAARKLDNQAVKIARSARCSSRFKLGIAYTL
jgi:hypothetical protein